MKKAIIFSVLAIVFTMSSFAQSKTEDIQKLIQLMKQEAMIDAQLGQMIPMFKQQASEQIRGSQANEKFDKYIAYMMDELKSITKRLVQDDVARIYDKHFTHEEVKDLIAFYESPTGQKTLDKTPEITGDMMNLMMTKYLPEFQEKLRTKLEEFK